jgi:hypothetical protein
MNLPRQGGIPPRQDHHDRYRPLSNERENHQITVGQITLRETKTGERIVHERVRAGIAQSGDVVTRMVNERDQCNDSRAISRARRSEVDRTRRDRPIAGKMASGLVDIMPPTVLDPLFHRLVDRPHDSAGNTED